MPKDFSVRFWGVRGSRPTPGERYIRSGGNTSCVEISAAGTRIILDAGTGCIGLGHALLAEPQQPLLFLLSHYHHDHIQGLPHFPPIYCSRSPLTVISPTTPYEERVWTYLSQSTGRILPERPLNSRRMQTEKIAGGETLQWSAQAGQLQIFDQEEVPPALLLDDGLAIQTLRSRSHPRGGSMCYRITWQGKSVVYATDIENYVGCDQELIAFARGAELIIHDAQYTEQQYANPSFPKQGWGHSTWAMAVETARGAGVQALALFHHDPDHSDDHLDEIEAMAKERFPTAFLAREGMVYTIPLES